MKQWQSIIDNTETQTKLDTQETVCVPNVVCVSDFLLLIFTVSFVPNVVCVSVFSIIDCHCFMCAQCCLCLCILYYWLSLFPVCPMLSVSLYCLLLIVTVSCVPNVVCVSVLSIIDCTQTTLSTQETVKINNREYRDTDNIGQTGNSDNQ
jgi:hypothetical protein